MENKMINFGFALLNTKRVSNIEEINSLEEKYNITLPEKFRFFITLFEIGTEKNHLECHFEDGYSNYVAGIVYNVFNYDEDEDDVMFHGFHSLEGVFSGNSADEEWKDRGLLPVAMCGHSGAVLVGTKKEESDIIFLQTMSGKIRKLDNDIFEFTRKLGLVEMDESEFDRGLKYSNIFRFWNEDKWIVKNEV